MHIVFGTLIGVAVLATMFWFVQKWAIAGYKKMEEEMEKEEDNPENIKD